MKITRRRILVTALFAALVLSLLWFQGILFRPEAATVNVPPLPGLPMNARRAVATARDIPRISEYPGFVAAIDPAEIAPRVVATISEVSVREGDAVEAGTRLLTLDDTDARARLAQARSAVDAARVAVDQSRLARERSEPLHERHAMSTQDWEATRAAHEIAVANRERAEAALAESENASTWYRVSAPFAGRVLSRAGEPGQLATPGRTVLTLYRPDRLRFDVAVPDAGAIGLELGRTFDVAFDGASARSATLRRILPASDPRTGTVTLQFDLSIVDDLRPGGMGRLRFPAGSRTALVVPAEAVETIGQIERVRVVRSGRVVPTIVRTGKTSQGLVEVIGGLEPGEEVLLP